MSSLRQIYYLYNLRRNVWKKKSELLAIQERKLRSIVKHAYENVEYYHRKFDSLGIKPEDIKNVNDLRKLPITTKEDLRQNFPDNIIARNHDINNCTEYKTSGSTGIPLRIVVDPRGNDYRAGLFGRPFFEDGLGSRDTMMFVGDARTFPTTLRWYQKLGFLRRIYFSAAEPVENHIPLLLEKNPQVLYVYSSYLYLLAHALQREGIDTFQPKVIFSTAEVLGSKERELISSVLGTRPFDLYGCVETERLAWECNEHVGYHMDIDSQVLEFVDGDDVVAKDEEGNIVVTCLYNYAMPLIRYYIGDIGVAIEDECPCGRGLPLMKSILGRENDMILRPDGRRVISPVFINIMRAIPGIFQYRIFQEDLKHLKISIVKDNKFTADSLNNIHTDVRHIVGEDMEIELSIVDEIKKEESGKIRAISSNVSNNTL